jgi:glucuronate isomerase
VQNDDRLFPADPGVRALARSLYAHTRSLPIVSPHGHCSPTELADNVGSGDPALEFVTRDHYVLRLLYSQGIPLEALGVRAQDGPSSDVDSRAVWQLFADHYHLFRATPSKLWLDYTMQSVFGLEISLGTETADAVYDEICARLSEEEFRPRALFERFGVEFLATTDASTDPLAAHGRLRASGWEGRVVPTFRPDDVVDPERAGFHQNLAALADLTGEDTATWRGYLDAIRSRRASFIEAGATSSDHGHPSAHTADLSDTAIEALFDRVIKGTTEPGDAEAFRGQMLVEMAAMSLDDGLVLQLHAGSWRGHNPTVTERFGPDMGADIPTSINYVAALKPLLDRFGNDPGLTIVAYTLDETTYSRELAPMAGHYPALRLGPPWWFYDSPEGIRRFYQQVIETAGFANTVGFNDDARSLLTIPARHDLVRRVNAGFLAGLVAEHRLEPPEAEEIATDLAYTLARRAFGVAP